MNARAVAPEGEATAGTVYLVGAGPGAVDLLTLRAARLLAAADIVLHDALVSPDVLALAPQARQIAVGKRCGKLSTAQQFINRQLLDAARHHRVVVRLKGGDPLLFGRAQEEISALVAAGIRVEVVPGISAAFGASASLLQSLTERGTSRSVAFLTPASAPGEVTPDWARAACNVDTAVIYMASRQAQAIADGLLAAGIPGSRPVVLVENASQPGERIVATRVRDLPEAVTQLGDGPALILLGEVYAHIVSSGQEAPSVGEAVLSVAA